ncbi:hypothetical protein V6N12_017563 [Hibiscus sabdariffa]|uniref:Uncharacterized protein n=1 Tax=Hibiscus sabdariffa TaxID=183260 RepID=A0ABR2CFW9_9ROSI
MLGAWRSDIVSPGEPSNGNLASAAFLYHVRLYHRHVRLPYESKFHPLFSISPTTISLHFSLSRRHYRSTETPFFFLLLPKVHFYSIKFIPIPRFTVIHYFYSNPVQVDGSP